MRPRAAAVITVAAAVLGGVTALLTASALDLGGAGAETTVYVPRASPPLATTTGAVPVPDGQGFAPATIYARRSPGVVTIWADLSDGTSSQGSGFIVDRSGTILTNAHVITDVGSFRDVPSEVSGAKRVHVEFKDGERVRASIVGWDLFADVGVVTVDPADHRLEPLPLGNSSSVVVGTPVAAIGSPFGNQSSLAVGVVSATGRLIPSLTSRYSVADAIQVDAPINRGNSGGPLLDAGGRVIGINAQIRTSSGNAEGVGFAIPINIARRSLEQLVSNGKVVYAYIGIKTQDVTTGIARAFGFRARRGALITSVETGTPGERAGLRGASRTAEFNGLRVELGGDLIVRIGDEPVRSSEDVSRIVTYELLPGQRVPFVVLRGGVARETVPVTLGERPARPNE